MEWEKKHSSLNSRHSKKHSMCFTASNPTQFVLNKFFLFIFKINIRSFQFDDLSIFIHCGKVMQCKTWG